MSRRKGTGTIFRRPGSRNWWVGYTSGGKRRQESAKSEKKGDAQALLTKRLGDTQRGIISSAKVGTITLAEGLKAHVADMKMNGKQSADDTARRIEKHILFHAATDDEPEGGYFLPGRLMATIATADVEAYKAHRINDDKAKPATLNRELAALRRAFRLAVDGGKLALMPKVKTLQEHNVRTGFFERAEFDAILKHLPEDVRPVLEFMYATGWRKSEALNLAAANVDLDAGTVKLDVGTTKSRKGRTIMLTPALAALLKKQVASIDLLKKKDVICPWIFHRADGTRIKSVRGAWEAAREAAGFPKKILHDLRRTAVRNLDRAGVPRSTAMAMVGHATEAIYRRYAIQDEAMLREGAEKLAAWTDAQAAAAKAKDKRGQLRSFGKRRAGGAGR